MQEKINRSLTQLKEYCDVLLKQKIDKWHDYLAHEIHASAHTIYNYVLDLKSFFEFISQHEGNEVSLQVLSELTLTSFRSYLSSRIKESSSAISNKRAISAIKNFYKFTKIENIHLNELSNPRTEKNLPRPISHAQTRQLMDLSAPYANQPKWIQLRDEAFFMLLYGCGLRITEALNLNIEDLNNHNLRIKGKRNKERIVPMIFPVFSKINTYLEASPHLLQSSMPLFIGIKGDRLSARVIQKQMEKIRLQLGLAESATPHSLRHSYASHLLAGGADLRSIQELMGHDSLASTQVYTKLEDQTLFETYMTTHPRAEAKNIQSSPIDNMNSIGQDSKK